MRFGIVLPQQDVDPATAIEAARLAEESGLDSVWVIDHLHGRPNPRRPVLECWSLLSAVAASTSRVTIGTLVMRVGLRAPLVSAHTAATINDISAGRLTVGIGIGDPTVKQEQQAYGIGYLPRAERIREAEETVVAMRQVARVPVWIGGASDDAIRLAAGADGLNLWVPPADLPETIGRAHSVSSHAELSWAGSWPKDGIDPVLRSGVEHVIVATGAPNYAERIQQITSTASTT